MAQIAWSLGQDSRIQEIPRLGLAMGPYATGRIHPSDHELRRNHLLACRLPPNRICCRLTRARGGYAPRVREVRHRLQALEEEGSMLPRRNHSPPLAGSLPA